MAGVRLEGIHKKYGSVTVVDNVNLSIRSGEFVTLLGASGSGKTTCLRMIAGFVSPNSGKVFIDEEDVTHVPPHRRNTGMVFQQYALFPHMTVAANVAFGLKVRRLPREEVRKKTDNILQLVRLDKYADRYPNQLSGGQRQRVALARAVVIGPRVLLLDEPLAALDLKLREELQAEIKRVQETLGITAVFVTHDQHEALGMSDRIVVMRDGVILQANSPTELYRHPNSKYVASFVGRMNFIEAVVAGHNGGNIVLNVPGEDAMFTACGAQGASFSVGSRCIVAFRPEDGRFEKAATNSVKARLEKANFSGSEWTLTLARPSKERLIVTVPQSGTIPDVGSDVSVAWSPERSILLAAEESAAAPADLKA